MKIRITKSIIVGIIIIIIAIGLIAYALIPKGAPQAHGKTYSASFTFYDIISNRTLKPLTSLTVEINSKNYSSSLFAPNVGNTSYVFYNLTQGNYNITVYSAENVKLYTESFILNENLTKNIVLNSQPLTVYVNLNGKISTVPYTVVINSSKVNLTKQLVPSLPLQISELPLGSYNISILYNQLKINSTSVILNGKITNVTLNTYLYNVTLNLFDQNKKPVSDAIAYLFYKNKEVFNSTSQKGSFFFNNTPPLNYSVVFNYKGINLTIYPNNIITVNKNHTTFNFTTYFTNATFKIKYQNDKLASGLLVKLSENLTGITSSNGTIKFNHVPANLYLNVKIYRGGIIVLKQQIYILSNSSNNFNFTLFNSTLNLNLVGVNNQSNFNSFTILQDSFNSSSIIFVNKTNISLSLYPSNYLVQIYLYTPTNETLLVYKSYITLNQTVTKTIILPAGFTIKVNTNNPSSTLALYYLSENYGPVLVSQTQGSSAIFNNLVEGTYKLVLFENGVYKNSTLVTILNSTKTTYLVNMYYSPIQSTSNIYPYFVLSAVLIILTASFAYLSYRSYKSKKSMKPKVIDENNEK